MIRKLAVIAIYSVLLWLNVHQVATLGWGTGNTPFPSSPGPLYQKEVKCSAFDMEMIFHSHANKTHFHKKIEVRYKLA